MGVDYGGSSVLVTGGAGFIGSHLVEELVRRRSRVTVVDNLTTGAERNLASVRGHMDLRTLDLRTDDLRPVLTGARIDLIFHLAGNAYVPPSVDNPRWDFETNTLGTLNLLEAVRDKAPQARIVYTSTAAVYGEGSSKAFLEEDPTVPVAPYGVSKLASERYVAVYAQLYGLRTASVRLFPVYGPRLRKQVVYDLIRKVHENQNELFIHGDGSQVRDCNHVSNVVHALLMVADGAPLQGEVYNVAGDEPVSVHDLARLICEAMGAAPRFIYSGSVRPGDAQRWVADIGRLRRLGYRPSMALAEGLNNTVAWFRRETDKLVVYGPDETRRPGDGRS